MSLKGAIFDLDGVIVSTVLSHFSAWKKMFSEYGKEFSFDDYKEKVDGIPRIDGARSILFDLSQEELELAAEKKQVYFLKSLQTEGVKIYDSTIDLVKALKAKKIKVAVISSSKNCLPILQKAAIDSLFDIILTGHDIKPGRGKPHPDVFLEAAEKLGLSAGECVVFEDAVLGVEAAKRAQFKAVGIDRYDSPERLKKADIVVDDLSKVTVEKLIDLFS
ncbi:MAG: beta-phosphoglucomutase family hydrolase [Candidatus Omnitrophica bacterium]|nr:beta-phosphoglucomutase family hydrolase [Candidatus Omnitrophota bacterium]